MFDLQAAISDWKRQAESDWRGDQSALAELEDHLREEFAALVRCGHAEAEAWSIAQSKLGEPTSLRAEFAKIAPLPMWDRIALASILGRAALAVASVTFLFAGRGRNLLPVRFFRFMSLPSRWVTSRGFLPRRLPLMEAGASWGNSRCRC